MVLWSRQGLLPLLCLIMAAPVHWQGPPHKHYAWDRACASCRPQLVKGFMQLYSVEQQRSQALEAHAAAFTSLKLTGKDAASPVISFAQKTFVAGQLTSKLHVIELGAPGE